MNYVAFFWLRLVLNDFSTVLDMPEMAVDSIRVCDDRQVRLVVGGQETNFVVEQSFYNEGAVTSNPDTTGQQLVYIEKKDAIFSGGMERCRYWNGRWDGE